MTGLWVFVALMAAVAAPSIAMLWLHGRQQAPGRHRGAADTLAAARQRTADLTAELDAYLVPGRRR